MAIVLLVLALAPCLFLLWYFYHRDKYEPEPKKNGPPLPRFSGQDFNKMLSQALPAGELDGKKEFKDESLEKKKRPREL